MFNKVYVCKQEILLIQMWKFKNLNKAGETDKKEKKMFSVVVIQMQAWHLQAPKNECCLELRA